MSVLLFCLLLPIGEPRGLGAIDGVFGGMVGQWQQGEIIADENSLLLKGLSSVYLLEHDSQTVFPIDGVPNVCLLTKDRILVSTSTGLYVFNRDGSLVCHHEEIFGGLAAVRERVVANPHFPKKADDLLVLLGKDSCGIDERFFRRPKDAVRNGHTWAVVKGDDWFIYWSERPDRIYLGDRELWAHEQTLSRHVPGVALMKQFEPSQAPISHQLSFDGAWQNRQEMLARPRALGFAASSRGFFIAREVGVPAPGLGNAELYIGSRLEVIVLDERLEVRNRHYFDGVFAGFSGDAVILVHDGATTRPPEAHYEQLEGSPEARARALLADYQVFAQRTLRPMMQRVPIPPG